MLVEIAKVAAIADNWLQEKFGRPYNAVLGIGLVGDLVRQGIALSTKIGSAHDLYAQILPILLDSALLLHQVGALSHRLEDRAGGPRGRRPNA